MSITQITREEQHMCTTNKHWTHYRYREMENKVGVKPITSNLPERDMDGRPFDPYAGYDDDVLDDAYEYSISHRLKCFALFGWVEIDL